MSSDSTQSAHVDEVEILEQTTIVNEFTGVTVRKLSTKNGERLEVESMRLGFRIRLDALGLEALSWQDDATVSGWLSTPFGPDGDHGPDEPRERNAPSPAP